MRPILAIAGLVFKEILRKKDFYVALVLIAVILLYAQGLEFYRVQNISRYLIEIGLAMIYLASVILTAALAARQYPSEIQDRTGPILFAKPISRWQFVAGKYLGSFIAGGSCFSVFYALFLGIVWLKAGEVSWALAFQAFYLFWLNLMLVSAMSSLFSYGLTVSANLTISLVIYLLINTYGAGLRELSEGLSMPVRWGVDAFYFSWPHFEFFDIRHRFVHEGALLPPDLMGLLTVYALFYSSAFLVLACFAIRRRPL